MGFDEPGVGRAVGAGFHDGRGSVDLGRGGLREAHRQQCGEKESGEDGADVFHGEGELNRRA